MTLSIPWHLPGPRSGPYGSEGILTNQIDAGKRFWHRMGSGSTPPPCWHYHFKLAQPRGHELSDYAQILGCSGRPIHLEAHLRRALLLPKAQKPVAPVARGNITRCWRHTDLR